MSLFLPQTPQDLNADWLSLVLDAPVHSVSVDDAHSGTTGRAVISIDCGTGTGLPDRLFVKLPPQDELQRAFVCSSGMGRREALFYQQLSEEVPLRVPHCYYAASDDLGEHYIMLLEHLEDGGCTFRNAITRMSPQYLRQVLAAFARLHTAYWESPRFETDLSWVQPPLQHEIAVELIGRALAEHCDSMPSVFREIGELYLERADAIHRLWQQGPLTLVHGDVHDANLFYDRDQPGFLDWALVARAPAMRDVGYFLAGSLEGDEQPDVARELLAWYRQQLLANGAPAPPAEELWRQYQWHAAYVWVGAAVTLAMGDAWQPVSYVKASLERIHHALEMLESVAAIRDATT